MILKLEQDPKIHITLSMDEASQLQGLLFLIGGNPDKQRRFFNDLSNELGRLGVPSRELKCQRGLDAIYFEDDDE